MKGAVIPVLVVIAMVQFMVKPEAEAAVTCQQVSSALAPCIPFLTKRVPTPSDPCCSGVKNLQNLAQTTADKQAACNCAKDAASRDTAIQEDAASSLPTKCNVQVNFPISRSTNCADIH